MFLTRKKMVLRFTLCSTTKFDDGTKCESYHKQHNPIHNIQFIKRTEFGGSRARGKGEKTICLRKKSHFCQKKHTKKHEKTILCFITPNGPKKRTNHTKPMQFHSQHIIHQAQRNWQVQSAWGGRKDGLPMGCLWLPIFDIFYRNSQLTCLFLKIDLLHLPIIENIRFYIYILYIYVCVFLYISWKN